MVMIYGERGGLVNIFFENISDNNCLQVNKETDRIQDDDSSNVKQSLFQKTLMFLKILLLHNFKSLKNNIIFIVIVY